MIKEKTILAVIPARANSKRLPGKNIKMLGNKPLLSWTIQAALQSKYIDEVIVSTDSEDISHVAKEYGANIPFIRPHELALDDTKSIDVVRHAIEYYKKKQKREFDYIILLQPTSPLREARHIDAAVEYLSKKNADAVISVCEIEHNPLWSNILPQNLSMENFLDHRYINTRSQDLREYYRLNGALYLCDTKRCLRENTFFLESNIYAYIMSQECSVDIDTELDFLLAQVILNKRGLYNEK